MDLEVVWSGAMLHVLSSWSQTKGELSIWPPQRGRPFNADPLDALDGWPCRDPSSPVVVRPRPRLVEIDDELEPEASSPQPAGVVP